jgi:hypothetical protein
MSKQQSVHWVENHVRGFVIEPICQSQGRFDALRGKRPPTNTSRRGPPIFFLKKTPFVDQLEAQLDMSSEL